MLTVRHRLTNEEVSAPLFRGSHVRVIGLWFSLGTRVGHWSTWRQLSDPRIQWTAPCFYGKSTNGNPEQHGALQSGSITRVWAGHSMTRLRSHIGLLDHPRKWLHDSSSVPRRQVFQPKALPGALVLSPRGEGSFRLLGTSRAMLSAG